MLATSLIIGFGIMGVMLVSKIQLLQPFSPESATRASEVQKLIETYFGQGQHIIWVSLFVVRYVIFKIVNNISLEVVLKIMTGLTETFAFLNKN